MSKKTRKKKKGVKAVEKALKRRVKKGVTGDLVEAAVERIIIRADRQDQPAKSQIEVYQVRQKTEKHESLKTARSGSSAANRQRIGLSARGAIRRPVYLGMGRSGDVNGHGKLGHVVCSVGTSPVTRVAAADNEELGSKIDEFLGEDFGLQASRERAALYRHAAHALSIEIETGIAVCSCHFKPITPPGGCADA